MRLSVTRREHFSAGHRLYNPAFSDERNAEVFGKCANPSGHGHNYVVEVTLEGKVDPETGFLFDLKELSSIIQKHILDDIDHRNLNEDVEWLRGLNPTTETLASAFWARLETQLPAGLLSRVRVIETEKNWVDCSRD